MALKETVEVFAIKKALEFMDKDPETNLPKLLDWFEKFDKKIHWLYSEKPSGR